MQQNIYDKNTIYHKGTKGMRWGYTNGKRNGNRTAKDWEEDWNGEFYKDTDAPDYFKPNIERVSATVKYPDGSTGRKTYTRGSDGTIYDHKSTKEVREEEWDKRQKAQAKAVYGLYAKQKYEQSPQKYVDKMLYALEDNSNYMKKKAKKAKAKAKKWIKSFFD